MNSHLQALNLIFSTLNVASIDVRKQDVIYLAQESGLKLGYSFGWRGDPGRPYSESLSEDLYALKCEDIDRDLNLTHSAKDQLNHVNILIDNCKSNQLGVFIKQCAEYHFLRAKSKLTHRKAIQHMVYDAKFNIKKDLKEAGFHGV